MRIAHDLKNVVGPRKADEALRKLFKLPVPRRPSAEPPRGPSWLIAPRPFRLLPVARQRGVPIGEPGLLGPPPHRAFPAGPRQHRRNGEHVQPRATRTPTRSSWQGRGLALWSAKRLNGSIGVKLVSNGPGGYFFRGHSVASLPGAEGQSRTDDTRIFSPLLYH